MAVDAFLKIDAIEGESIIKGYEKQIAIESYSFGMSNNVTFAAGSGGGGAGKANIQDIHFTKLMDKTSPALMQALMVGTHIKSIVLTLRKTTGAVQLDYFSITLEDCCLSSYQSGASAGGDSVMEQVSVGFARIKIAYKVQDAKGATVSTANASWDIQKGAKVA